MNNKILIPFERKAVNEKGEFEGYGSAFGNVDLGNDLIEKGAFTEDLAEWKSKGQFPMLPWMHNISEPIGDWLEMYEDENGLFVKGKLWIDENNKIEQAVRAYNLLTGTSPKGLSIGYSCKDCRYEESEGKKIRILEKIKLYEISVVGFGMNPKAEVTQIKGFVNDEGDILDIRKFEKALRDGGLSLKQAKTLLSGGYAALNRDESSSNDETKQGANRDELALVRDFQEGLKDFLNYIKE